MCGGPWGVNWCPVGEDRGGKYPRGGGPLKERGTRLPGPGGPGGAGYDIIPGGPERGLEP